MVVERVTFVVIGECTSAGRVGRTPYVSVFPPDANDLEDQVFVVVRASGVDMVLLQVNISQLRTKHINIWAVCC